MTGINFYHVDNAVRIDTSYSTFGLVQVFADNIVLQNSFGHATQTLFNFSNSNSGEILAANQIGTFQVMNSNFIVDNTGPMIPMGENMRHFQLNGLIVSGNSNNLLNIYGGATMGDLDIVSYTPGSSPGFGSLSSINSITGPGLVNTGYLLPDANVASDTLYLSNGGANCDSGSVCIKDGSGTTYPITAGTSGQISSVLMNEGAGQILHDSLNSAGDLTGTGSGITWVTEAGIPGTVPHFRTNAAVVSGVTAANFERTQAFSGCVWTSFDNVNSYQNIMSDVFSGPQYTGWVFAEYPDGLSLKITNNESTGNQVYVTAASSALLVANTLYHLCFTYDGASGATQAAAGSNSSPGAGGLLLYINGGSVGTYTHTNALTGSILNTNTFYAGNITGTESDLRLWNRKLSASEISAIYALGPQ